MGGDCAGTSVTDDVQDLFVGLVVLWQFRGGRMVRWTRVRSPYDAAMLLVCRVGTNDQERQLSTITRLLLGDVEGS